MPTTPAPPRRLRWPWYALALAAALTPGAVGATAAAAAPSAARGQAAASASQAAAPPLGDPGPLGAQPACPQPAPGQAECLAILDADVNWDGRTWATGPAPASLPRTAPSPRAAASAGPAPYMAADLQSAYKLPSALLGERKSIAIVDAGDDPSAESDLAVYRAANDLPACTTANGCFAKVNQEGQPGSYPPVVSGWPVEESLDLDMVSAICPNCSITLVEANSAADSDMYAAEDEAAALGANVISNSWGQSAYAGEAADCSTYFDHPGTAITAAAGDSGFSVNFPAACDSVTAVGGTTLYQESSARGWGEVAWMDTGSGCSAYIPKPAWQHDHLCGMRTTADVSAVADPDTPVAVYGTFSPRNRGSWVAVGGTSVSTPIIASVYALAGNTASIGPGASWLYAHHRDLYDITYQPGLANIDPQANGDCGGSYLCTAANGYDGLTGWGTPDSIGAF
jgi:subtilase family serine protease